MNPLNRREFVGIGVAALGSTLLHATPPERKMKLNLSWGAIGVSASQTEAMALAQRFGFEAIDANPNFLAGLSDAQLNDLLADMKQKNLVWGSAGLPVEFRADVNRFNEGMKTLPKTSAALKRAGVTRITTYMMPCEDKLTYLQNFKQHATRLREAAKILADNGQRLGLEYVGTQSLRDSKRFPFIHTMAETKELIADIGTGNVGFVLDCWHWWTAGETADDLVSLTNDQVVSVDLSDAPAGIAKEQQVDTKRELPASTGIIDVGTFLASLMRIGYDGPVRAEPFNRAVNDLDNEAACTAVMQSLKKAFELASAKA